MAIEELTYVDLGERLNISAEAARALARRMNLPRQKANDGKTVVAADFSQIQHKRSPLVRRADVDALKAQLAELKDLVEKAEAMAARQRADYERERERAERLADEICRMFADLMAAKEKIAHLEGELSALRRPWWLRLAGYRESGPHYATNAA